MRFLQTIAGIGATTLLLVAPYSAAAATTSMSEQLVRSFFADAPVMIAIADCESGFRQFNAQGAVLYGGYKHTMVGVFQIAKLHQPAAASLGLDITTLAGNLVYARYLYEQEGTTPWLSSESCWGAQS